jgi:hypothetical protein
LAVTKSFELIRNNPRETRQLRDLLFESRSDSGVSRRES